MKRFFVCVRVLVTVSAGPVRDTARLELSCCARFLGCRSLVPRERCKRRAKRPLDSAALSTMCGPYGNTGNSSPSFPGLSYSTRECKLSSSWCLDAYGNLTGKG
ncbi:hypothetical protein CMEL01_15136 [Colletotrichum melonis]|uniref:Secreted protein n=1 Tax=Colletotrichum melonis TaxID=1209925 RepID=A0AAI9ULT7_9PEZI|nr:hypothetical protein CMEL01_15136 [Colletotrichum melonis]